MPGPAKHVHTKVIDGTRYWYYGDVPRPQDVASTDAFREGHDRTFTCGGCGQRKSTHDWRACEGEHGGDAE